MRDVSNVRNELKSCVRDGDTEDDVVEVRCVVLSKAVCEMVTLKMLLQK